MKLLALACVLGLNALLVGCNNTSSLIAQRSCFSKEGRSYPHGSEIIIGQSTYRCNNGRWVRVTS